MSRVSGDPNEKEDGLPQQASSVREARMLMVSGLPHAVKSLS